MVTPLKVVVADDHARFRGIVREALEADGCAVVAEAADADGAVAACVEHEPDVVLLDIHMPGSGIRAAHEISSHQASIAVVMPPM